MVINFLLFSVRCLNSFYFLDTGTLRFLELGMVCKFQLLEFLIQLLNFSLNATSFFVEIGYRREVQL